ncbi:serine hydrolase [Acidisphaera sp. S103]|uniref:serine hydrolase domain-containing protein n=1 Tax=Acidisphaera sp. S103 TaxID=1747223 RepID=UPI00131EA65C|nr:serine hydrolase domain-containing protein [Acidisphaera sp. S103]
MTDKPALPRAEPEAVGMSSVRLARIVTALNREIEAGQLPGAVIAIARRGHLVFHEAVGSLGPDRNTPMPLDALFAMASMTKPVTGVAGLMLWEEGRLGLADPIERFLPQLGDRRVAMLTEGVLAGRGPIETVPVERSITIQDLMRHTSGLTYGGRGTTAVHALYPASSNVAGASLDAASFLDGLAAAPLLYQPGTVWDYGLSIDVIGLVVEAISGQTLGAFLEQRLFQPLGMVDTSFQVPRDKVARLARPLPRDPDTGAAQVVPDRTQALRFECGGGGLVSSALDYLRFAQMLLGGGVLGETRILGRKTVEAMRTNRVTPDIENRIAELDPNAEGYGFGLTVAVREKVSTLMGSPGEFYWNGAYGTLWWADPAEDLAVVFMAQVPGEQKRRFRVLINALVYQALAE